MVEFCALIRNCPVCHVINYIADSKLCVTIQMQVAITTYGSYKSEKV